jgi:Mlc titration factor MtfA (ptsG expression regulator)
MGTGLGISVVIIILAGYFLSKSLKKNTNNYIIPPGIKQILSQNVAFYNNLDDKGKVLFENRVKDFLANVAVRGVNVTIDGLDRVLVASGAIIPIFAFPEWRYSNISEVLLYKGTFNKEYNTDGEGRNVLGMVGDGAMHREMILSQPSLRASFRNPADGQNTAIHEFAHLIDKADGATDGIPEYLLAQPYLVPWVAKMHETITEMKAQNYSDIDIYGATNDTEFFAVVAEYFFERPDQLKTHHPELYDMLEQMFHG